MTAKNSRALAFVLHLLVLAAIAALFITGRDRGFAAQEEALTENHHAFDAAAGSLRPQVGGTYTAGLDQQAAGLLDCAHNLQLSTARVSKDLYQRIAGLTGCATFLVLIALFLIFRNSRTSRRRRVWILVSHSFLCLVLLLVFATAVLGRQLAIQVETAPAPPKLLDFMASGHAQVGKIYTVKRYEVLFQFLEIESTITNGLVETMQSGAKLAASVPPFLAVLAILNAILMARIRNTSENL